MKKLLLSIAFLLPFALIAQTVKLCEKYDAATGETSGYYETWDIKPNGGYIYIVYTQSTAIKEPLAVEIQKKEDGEYKTYELHNFLNDVSSGKKYAMYDMKFTEEGSYTIIIKTKNGKFLASATTKINVTDDSNDDDDKVDSDYYKESTVKFGTDVSSSGEITGEATEFKLYNGYVKVRIKVSNDKPFKSEKVKISVYKKLGTDNVDNTKLMEDIPVTGIDNDWDWFDTYIEFKEKGNYIIDVWNKDEVFINTGYLKIK